MYIAKPLLFICAATLAATTTAFAAEKVDLTTVHRIKSEAFENSQVMDHMFYLTDVNGPRLTGSPGYEKAANWVVKKMKDLGAENSHLEKWGPFGKGWTFDRFSMHMIEPAYTSIAGFPLAWSAATNGVFTGEPVAAVLSATSTDEDRAKFKGKLKGKLRVFVNDVQNWMLVPVFFMKQHNRLSNAVCIVWMMNNNFEVRDAKFCLIQYFYTINQ